MKRFRYLITILGMLVAPAANAADDLGAFYSPLRSIFSKYYPAAAVATRDQTVTFDHDTRLFMIHEPLKTGEWQDATERRGPRKAGIFCEIVSESGPYSGAAVVPQTFDEHYFSVLLLAPYSGRLNRHLHVRLSYPAGASKEFLKEFTEAIHAFNAY